MKRIYLSVECNGCGSEDIDSLQNSSRTRSTLYRCRRHTHTARTALPRCSDPLLPHRYCMAACGRGSLVHEGPENEYTDRDFLRMVGNKRWPHKNSVKYFTDRSCHWSIDRYAQSTHSYISLDTRLNQRALNHEKMVSSFLTLSLMTIEVAIESSLLV